MKNMLFLSFLMASTQTYAAEIILDKDTGIENPRITGTIIKGKNSWIITKIKTSITIEGFGPYFLFVKSAEGEAAIGKAICQKAGQSFRSTTRDDQWSSGYEFEGGKIAVLNSSLNVEVYNNDSLKKVKRITEVECSPNDENPSMKAKIALKAE